MAGVIKQVASGIISLAKSPFITSTQNSNSQSDDPDSSLQIVNDETLVSPIPVTTPDGGGVVDKPSVPDELRRELFKDAEEEIERSPRNNRKFAGEVSGLEQMHNASVSDVTAVSEAEKEDPTKSCGKCQGPGTAHMLPCSECKKLYHYACTGLPPFQINIFNIYFTFTVNIQFVSCKAPTQLNIVTSFSNCQRDLVWL